jgi:catechol 2,3-dioxygenase-like lactoylglutathione lyase family enzyme
MLGRTSAHWWGVVLDAPDAQELARFYARLLDWTIVKDEPGWAAVTPEDGVSYLAFQTAAGYERPVWPSADGRQQMMMHIDLEVADLEPAVALAIEAGATLADYQPQEKVRVMLDPAGHPFCLYVDAES